MVRIELAYCDERMASAELLDKCLNCDDAIYCKCFCHRRFLTLHIDTFSGMTDVLDEPQRAAYTEDLRAGIRDGFTGLMSQVAVEVEVALPSGQPVSSVTQLPNWL